MPIDIFPLYSFCLPSVESRRSFRQILRPRDLIQVIDTSMAIENTEYGVSVSNVQFRDSCIFHSPSPSYIFSSIPCISHLANFSFSFAFSALQRVFQVLGWARYGPMIQSDNIMQNDQGSLKQFEILKKVGEGAFGQVYQVRRRVDNQIYALKKVRMTGMKEKQKENALNEIRILASLDDDYIIKFKQAFYDNLSGYLCIVMEFATGGDLMRIINQNLKARTRIKQNDIWKALVDITRGLKSLHDKKILHRDLKAANIFISANGTYKLGDLNVSKVLKKGLAYTQTGTPYYASPQVWQDLPYDMKSDIWSLGCVIYQMAALQPPFKATDLQSLYKKVKAGVFKPIPSSYSVQLSEVVNSMLKLKPKDRPSTQQILKHPAVLRHNGGNNISNNSNQYSEPLLNTIKFNPFNLNALKGRLPKASYENEGGKSHRQSLDNLHRQRVYSACGTRKAYEYSPQPAKKVPEKQKEKPNVSAPYPPKQPLMLPPKPTPRRTEQSKNESKESGARLRRIGQEVLQAGRYPRSSSVNR